MRCYKVRKPTLKGSVGVAIPKVQGGAGVAQPKVKGGSGSVLGRFGEVLRKIWGSSGGDFGVPGGKA